jgi:hypothetical protein
MEKEELVPDWRTLFRCPLCRGLYWGNKWDNHVRQKHPGENPQPIPFSSPIARIQLLPEEGEEWISVRTVSGEGFETHRRRH